MPKMVNDNKYSFNNFLINLSDTIEHLIKNVFYN